MNCENCGHKETHILNSRFVKESNQTRRRRECKSCKIRWTTYESGKITTQDKREFILRIANGKVD